MSAPRVLAEDILKQYGVTPDYWRDPEAGKPIRASEAIQYANTLLSEPGVEVPEKLEELLRQADSLIESVIRLDKRLSEVNPAMRSEMDEWLTAQRDDALKVYEATVWEARDTGDLCELGYLLLQRCRVEELPVCVNDFNGSIFEFGDGEELVINRWPLFHQEDPGPEFADKPALLNIAITAFGLVHVRYLHLLDLWGEVEEDVAITRSESWRWMLAMDGLRAAFLCARNLDGVEAVLNSWYGDFGMGEAAEMLSLVEPIELKFREADAYLRGWRKAAPAVEEIPTQQRFIIWQLKELLSEFRSKQITPQDLESLENRLAEKLAGVPSYVVDRVAEQLGQEFGERWHQLPQDVRRLITQAEYLRRHLATAIDVDWAPVVLQYVRAVETLLRGGLGPKLDAALPSEHPATRLNIEGFRDRFQSPLFAGLKGLAGADSMRELGPALADLIRNYRNPVVHGAEPMSAVKVMEMRSLLLGTKEQHLGLLWKIARLCSGA